MMHLATIGSYTLQDGDLLAVAFVLWAVCACAGFLIVRFS